MALTVSQLDIAKSVLEYSASQQPKALSSHAASVLAVAAAAPEYGAHYVAAKVPPKAFMEDMARYKAEGVQPSLGTLKAEAPELYKAMQTAFAGVYPGGMSDDFVVSFQNFRTKQEMKVNRRDNIGGAGAHRDGWAPFGKYGKKRPSASAFVFYNDESVPKRVYHTEQWVTENSALPQIKHHEYQKGRLHNLHQKPIVTTESHDYIPWVYINILDPTDIERETKSIDEQHLKLHKPDHQYHPWNEVMRNDERIFGTPENEVQITPNTVDTVPPHEMRGYAQKTDYFNDVVRVPDNERAAVLGNVFDNNHSDVVLASSEEAVQHTAGAPGVVIKSLGKVVAGQKVFTISMPADVGVELAEAMQNGKLLNVRLRVLEQFARDNPTLSRFTPIYFPTGKLNPVFKKLQKHGLKATNPHNEIVTYGDVRAGMEYVRERWSWYDMQEPTVASFTYTDHTK